MMDGMNLDQMEDLLLAQVIQKMNIISLINFKKSSKWVDPFIIGMRHRAIFRIPHEIHITVSLDQDDSIIFDVEHFNFTNGYSNGRCLGAVRYTEEGRFEEEFCIAIRGLRFSAIRFHGLWKEEENGEQITKTMERILSSLSKYSIQCEELSTNRVQPTGRMLEVLKPKRLEVASFQLSCKSLESKMLKKLRKVIIRTDNREVVEFCRKQLTGCRVEIRILSTSPPIRQILAFLKEMESTNNSLRLHGTIETGEFERHAVSEGRFVVFPVPGRRVSYLVHVVKRGMIVIRCGGCSIEARRCQSAEEIQKTFRKFHYPWEVTVREAIAKEFFD